MVLTISPAADSTAQCEPTTLKAVGLGYAINGTTILTGVDALFEPRKLTAVMGSSGAGKTTLLNTLALRAPGQRTGKILVNGAPMSMDQMRLQLSYMPQDDILHAQLTVQQMLCYSAMLRCPGAWTQSEKITRVESIMNTLGISSVADSKLFSISGGQRKRASAAVEFLSGRPLLFMDEPTSGLDAATAKSLVDTLSHAAHVEARTVIATIHQPSWTLLNKFDSLLVLAPRREGGTIVFDGQPAELPTYFSEGSSAVPDGTNPADHLMHVLHNEGGDKWAKMWLGSKRRQERAKAMNTENNRENGHGENGHVSKAVKIYPISYFEQLRVLFIRTTHIWVADPQQGQLIMKMLIAVNTVIVLLLHGMPNNLSKANGVFYLIVTQLTVTMTPLVVILPEEKAVVLREYRNGVFSANTYWLSRFLLALVHSIVVATLTTCFMYPLIGMSLTPYPSKQVRWWIFQFLYVSSIMMLGLALGIASPSALAGNKVVMTVFIPWLVASGVFPPLRLTRPTVFWLRYPNLFTWAVKIGLATGFTNNGEKALETVRDTLSIHLGNVDSCYQALAAAFVITFLLGMASTHYILNRADKSAGQRASSANAALQSGTASLNDFGGGDGGTFSVVVPLLQSAKVKAYGAAGDVEAPSSVGSIPIEVRSVTYRHPGKPKVPALTDVSIRFEAGAVTVVMGPSGAGKSTLLNLLTSRLPSGTSRMPDGGIVPCITGQVLVDNTPADFEAFKKIGTLTPQDEHFPEVLTVRQTLLYTAELRSPSVWTYAQKVARVEEILIKLDLYEKRDNIIGTPLKIGISGGQKKRLSIAMDLLAERPVMLLDEPTTGLDAFAALNVVDTVVTLATDQRRTVICTLHQPPWSTVLRFNQLTILALGNVIYDGKATGLPAFLRIGGSPSPSNENPADHVMSVLSDGIDKWIRTRNRVMNDATERDVPVAPTLSPDELAAMLKDRYPVSIWAQYTILLRRSAYIFVIDEDQFPDLLKPITLGAIFIGLAFRNFGVNVFFAGAVLFGITSHGMSMLAGVVLNIPTERELILREYRNGTYTVGAYWFARTTVSVVGAFVTSFPTFIIYLPLVNLKFDPYVIFNYWAASVLNATIFVIFAGLIGLLCKNSLMSAQVSDPIGSAMILFSGSVISRFVDHLSALAVIAVLLRRRFIKPYAYPIYYGLPISYAFEIALTAVLENKGEDGKDVLDYYKLRTYNRKRDYAVLCCMVLFWTGVGYFVARKKLTAHD